MNQVHGAVGEISRKVRAVVHAAVLFEAACNKDLGKSISERELYIGIGFVITQQDVEARLLLLNEIIFERQRLALVLDDDVLNVHGLAHQRAGLGIVAGRLQ